MKRIAALTITSLLAACGGGGDSAPPTTPPAASVSAEGFWTGTASNGVVANVAILENGETWGVYTSRNTLVGALYGVTNSSAGTLSGSGRDFNIPSGSVSAGTYTGTYTPKKTINVAFSSGGTFSGTYDSAYDQPASAATLAGAYSGWGVSGNAPVQSANVTISSSGAITVPASNGCSASGTATPRASGKNVFDVTVTFTGTNCALGNGTVTRGVAYYDTGSREVLVMAMNPAKSDGFIYVGAK